MVEALTRLAGRVLPWQAAVGVHLVGVIVALWWTWSVTVVYPLAYEVRVMGAQGVGEECTHAGASERVGDPEKRAEPELLVSAGVHVCTVRKVFSRCPACHQLVSVWWVCNGCGWARGKNFARSVAAGVQGRCPDCGQVNMVVGSAH